MRASQKNNYDSHGNEVRWPPGCLFFSHEGHGCSRISFVNGLNGWHGFFSRGIRILSHAEDAECAEVHASILLRVASGVLIFLTTDGKNNHESFVNGFYGLYGYTSLNLSSLAIRMDASNATHENL